jgi:hypothetical protein
MATFGLFKITNGTSPASISFYFRAPTNSYDGVESKTGITEVTDNDEKEMPACSISELLGSSQAVRAKLKFTPSANKSDYGEIICAADKADTIKKAQADGGLVGETIHGRSIVKVMSPRRRANR